MLRMLVLGGAGAAFLATAAIAGEAPRRPPAPVPAPTPEARHDWTGVYAGFTGGYARTDAGTSGPRMGPGRVERDPGFPARPRP